MQDFRLKVALFLAVGLGLLCIDLGIVSETRQMQGGMFAIELGCLIIIVVTVFYAIGKRRGVL